MEVEKLYNCFVCGENYHAKDICCPSNHPFIFSNKCKWCSNATHFRNSANNYILNNYKLRCDEYPDWLLQIEIIRAKIRWVLRGGETKYITYKKEKMITSVTNSVELRKALNENLHAILTKKRKLLVAKEVNNTLGKILSDVKMEIMQNALSGNQQTISWFDRNIKPQIGNGTKKKKLKYA